MAIIQNEEYTIRITDAGDGSPKLGSLVEFKIGASNYPFVEVGEGYYHIDVIPTGKYEVWVDSVNTGETRGVGTGQVSALGNELDSFLVGTADNFTLEDSTSVKTTLGLENVSNYALPDPTGEDGKFLSVSADSYSLDNISVNISAGNGIDVTSDVVSVNKDQGLQFNGTTGALKLGPHYLSMAASGVYSGGTLAVSGPIDGNVNISALEGFVIDTSNFGVDSIVTTPVSTGAIVHPISAGSLLNNVTYIGMDSVGSVVEWANLPTPEQRRDNIFLGVAVHPDGVNVAFVNNLQDVSSDITGQLHDLSRRLGYFNIEGNGISANGVNLSINKAVGEAFKTGVNFVTNPKDPDTNSLPAKTLSQLRYRTQTGVEDPTSTTVLRPGFYDDGGTETAISPTSNKATIQRVYVFPSNEIRIQFGQTIYSSFSDGVDAVGKESFITDDNIKENGLLLCQIVLKADATDLSDPSQALFYQASRFGEVGSIGSALTGTLQNAYDNSIDPEILTDATRGALTLRRGSGADTDNVIEVQNGAGTNTFEVTGGGVVSLGSTTNSTPTQGDIYRESNTTKAVTSEGDPHELWVGLGQEQGDDSNVFTDANTLTINRIYKTDSSWTGSPYVGTSGKNQGYLLHLGASNLYGTQWFFGTDDWSNGRMFSRAQNNGTWDTDWTEVGSNISGDATIGGTATISGLLNSEVGHYNLNATSSIVNGILDIYGSTLTGSKYIGMKQTSGSAFLYAGASGVALSNELHLAIADASGLEQIPIKFKDWGLQLQAMTNATPVQGDIWNNGTETEIEGDVQINGTTYSKNTIDVQVPSEPKNAVSVRNASGDVVSLMYVDGDGDGMFYVYDSSGVTRFEVDSDGSSGWRTRINGSALIDNDATINGMVNFGTFTTTEKNALSPVAGSQVFDSTLGKMCFYNGTAWETITSS